jgi:hypothetical protein
MRLSSLAVPLGFFSIGLGARTVSDMLNIAAPGTAGP